MLSLKKLFVKRSFHTISSLFPNAATRIKPHGYIEIETPQGPLNLSLMWLRHNSPSISCFHPQTKEKIICSSRLSKFDLIPLKISFLQEEKLIIKWRSNHLSVYNLSELIKYGRFTNAQELPHDIHGIFNINNVKQFIPRFQASDLNTQNIMKYVELYGYCVVDGFGLDNDKLIESFSPANLKLIKSHYGQKEYITNDKSITEKNENTDQLGYTNNVIHLHSDLPFIKRVPQYQILHCMEQAPIGGENYIVDTQMVWDLLPASKRILADREVVFDRQQKNYSSTISAPLITLDDQGQFKQVRSSYFTVAPFCWEDVNKYYASYNLFHRVAQHLASQIKLLKGSYIIYDNHRCLHGRAGFTGSRLMVGTYLSNQIKSN